MMLLLTSVAISWFCIFGNAVDEIETVLPDIKLKLVGKGEHYTRKQISALTKQFTNYYLYFNDGNNYKFRNGGLQIDKSFPQTFSNATYKALSNSVKSCVRREFINRVLTREQISWRNRSDEKPRKSLSSNNGTSNITQNHSLNSTDSKLPQNTTSDSSTSATGTDKEDDKNDDKDKNNKIHNHLIFVLLLPNHPYSQDLRKIITTVTPMYPQATIVLGNAYEFKDMISKYYVSSFPKILYFRSGIYLESYDGVYSTEDIAAQFADWMYALPQAVPIPFEQTYLAHRTAHSIRELDIYAPGGQMRLGLALHPLPLTVQYTLLNFTIPGWMASYWPMSLLSNDTRDEVFADVSVMDSLSVPVSVEGSALASEKVSAHSAGDGVFPAATTTTSTSTSVGLSNTIATVAILDGSVSSTPISDAAATSDTIDLEQLDAQPTQTPASTHIANPLQHHKDVPIIVSITVPMPNVEPFLGSLENYAVWDTRMFLLAGLYAIVRFLFLVHKWIGSIKR